MSQTQEERNIKHKLYLSTHQEEVSTQHKLYCEIHHEELLAYGKAYHEKNREKQNAYGKVHKRNLRIEVLNHYGGKCVCCGETIFEFLSIDHINGGGRKHRQEINAYGSGIIQWLKNNNFPDGFQILCYNCHNSKEYYGECPHKEMRKNA